MTLELYYNKSENNVVSKDLEHLYTVSGNMRDELNISNPTILISTAVYNNFNYAYIAEFDRYYYVDKPVIWRDGLAIISLKTDVLMTFRDDIYELECIVERSQSSKFYNLYINDGTYKLYSDGKVKSIPFPNKLDAENYVLVVAGGSEQL